MTFKQIQDELLSVPAARFKETQRASVQRWINDRYAELWGLEEWNFRHVATTLTVVGGNNAPTMPADMGQPEGIWLADGTRLIYLPSRDFYTMHLSGTSSGSPSSFTVVNGQVYLDPTPSGNGTYTFNYLKDVTLLSADGDIPAFPVEYHYLLVHGATATGSVQTNDFTYQFAEQRWQNGIDAMRKNCLDDQDQETQQWGNYMDTWRQ